MTIKRSAPHRLAIALAASGALMLLSHAARASSPDDLEATRLAGDFNGDKIADVIIVTSYGSYEYTGLPGGGFTENVWVQQTSDFATGVLYTVGDYNGDGCSDVIIERGSGSTEWFGNGPGCVYQGTGLSQGSWNRPDLNPTAGVAYTVGDFNGDGCSDLIIQTYNTGSEEYLGEGPTCKYGTIHTRAGNTFFGCSAFLRGDLGIASAVYDVGDYNGDGATDLLINTASGIYEYTGIYDSSLGGFNSNVWSTTQYNWNNSSTWSRDFNGDTKDDFLLETMSSTTEYLGLQQGGFYASQWSTNRYGWNGVNTYIGDFNGDDVSDVIFFSGSGVDMWIGLQNPEGGFNDWWGTSNFNVHDGRIWVGDYNGDGFTDLIGENLSSGTTEWFGNQLGHLTQGSWYRPDLTSAYFTFFFPPVE